MADGGSWQGGWWASRGCGGESVAVACAGWVWAHLLLSFPRNPEKEAEVGEEKAGQKTGRGEADVGGGHG